MSKIAFVLGELGPHKAEVVRLLRSSLAIEVGQIVTLAGSGRPLFTRQLFERSEQTFPITFQSLLAELERLGVGYAAYELLDSQEFSDADPNKLYRINAPRMQNMIATRERSINEQIALGALQDGDQSGRH